MEDSAHYSTILYVKPVRTGLIVDSIRRPPNVASSCCAPLHRRVIMGLNARKTEYIYLVLRMRAAVHGLPRRRLQGTFSDPLHIAYISERSDSNENISYTNVMLDSVLLNYCCTRYVVVLRNNSGAHRG